MSRKPRTHRVTLSRVAQDSNVSVTTASLILSGRPECLSQFQPTTVERVRRSAEQLGYQANLFASSLLANRSSFFALIMRGGHSREPQAWQYAAYESELLYGVTEASPPEVYPVVAMLGPGGSRAKVRSIERIMAGGVFGTIVRTPDALLEPCLHNRITRGHPTVVIFPERLEDWPENAIDVDNRSAGGLAGELLIGAGASRWLILRDGQYHAGQALRQEGIEARARQADAAHTVVELPPGGADQDLESLVADRVRETRCDGIFAMTLRGAGFAVAACRMAGVDLGREVRLVGCDCAFRFQAPDPPITSIDVSWFDAGAAAIQHLVCTADAGESRFPTVVLPPRVIEGQTCPVPADLKTAS